MLEGASVENEVGWRIEDFPRVLQIARESQLACLGGQFQFRFLDGTCEMYWLDANSSERRAGEPWHVYVQRSNDEVTGAFADLCSRANFDDEIASWEFVRNKREEGMDPMQYLWFVAYFVTELEYRELGSSDGA
jgi:hypothetical protein